MSELNAMLTTKFVAISIAFYNLALGYWNLWVDQSPEEITAALSVVSLGVGIIVGTLTAFNLLIKFVARCILFFRGKFSQIK